MNYCKFCGKQLVEGQCDCYEFQTAARNVNNQQGQKEPFLIPSFKLNLSSISGFISSIRDLSGMSEPMSNASDPYEHNVPIVPDCIEPEENEIVLKQYNIAKLRTRLKLMKAEGRLMVTNRRVLFRAAGTSMTGNLLQEHQFNIDEIGGIEMHKDYKFSFLSFFGVILLYIAAMTFATNLLANIGNGGTVAIGIILGVLGLAPTFVVYKHFWLKLFCAIVACSSFSMANASASESGFLTFLIILATIVVIVNTIIICYVPNLVIKIKQKSGTGAIVIGSQKVMFKRKTGDDYSGFAEVMPWEDTMMAINEVGTMIDDIQKQGDYAIDKWS